MISGAEYRQVGQGRGPHAARQKHGILGALEQGVLSGYLELVGVVAVAGVADFLLRPNRIGEGAGLVDRG